MINPQDVVDAINTLLIQNLELKLEVERLTFEKQGNRPKLSDSEVKRIRYMKREGAFSNVQLADMFDVNPGTISRIVRNIYHRSTK